MAIVRRIVEDHGGAIDAESQPGRGNDRDRSAAPTGRRPTGGAASGARTGAA